MKGQQQYAMNKNMPGNNFAELLDFGGKGSIGRKGEGGEPPKPNSTPVTQLSSMGS
jgi:hypothetical protein